MKRLLPVVFSAVALVFTVVMMMRPVPQAKLDRPAPTSTSSTTTTVVTSLQQPWGTVSAGAMSPPLMDMCTNVMVDVNVTDLAVLGNTQRWVKVTGSSGNLYSVTPVVLGQGTNPVIMQLCSRQDPEWRPRLKAPWGESDFTIKSYPRCVHVITDVATDDDSITLTSFCPVPKS